MKRDEQAAASKISCDESPRCFDQNKKRARVPLNKSPWPPHRRGEPGTSHVNAKNIIYTQINIIQSNLDLTALLGMSLNRGFFD
jgi:hypothetical protein